jgi:hypothetical protein
MEGNPVDRNDLLLAATAKLGTYERYRFRFGSKGAEI